VIAEVMTGNIEFLHPWWLAAFIFVAYIAYRLYFTQSHKEASLMVPEVKASFSVRTWKTIGHKWLPVLKLLAISMFIIAMARPRMTLQEEVVKADGIDIMMVLDLSSSMLAKDFNPDRLEVSKLVAKEFIEKRPHDRIGLVVFAGESYTQCPLTTDHNILQDFLFSLQTGILQDGTAIGMGLATAVNRIKDSDSKSKIVILLTDGVNNAGYIKPVTAAEIAKSFGIKVYTIGVGTMGQAVSPVSRRGDGQYIFGLANVEIDTELLENISEMTGGRYFRAVDRKSLEDIYSEIDKLEKTEIEVTVFKRYSELFRWFLYSGLLLLLVYLMLRFSIFRTFT
jgi:Ca-activated chloride channel homolog